MGALRKVALTLGVLILLGGIAGLVYPFVGEWINNRQYENVVSDYQEIAQEMPVSRSEAMISEAIEYNKKILARGVVTALSDAERAEYESMLPVSELTGIMGYLEIPAINIKLPIYHGTDEKVLQVGIGHLEGSSLPIGGKGTHTVLTGHSGLPSTMIFTDLDQLKIGDTFTVTVLDYTVTYEVDGVEVMLPEDVSLQIDPDLAECTLITCTPIGANTHRLLVHAHQISNTKPSEE